MICAEFEITELVFINVNTTGLMIIQFGPNVHREHRRRVNPCWRAHLALRNGSYTWSKLISLLDSPCSADPGWLKPFP